MYGSLIQESKWGISPSGASDFLDAQKVTKDAFKGRGISISPFP